MSLGTQMPADRRGRTTRRDGFKRSADQGGMAEAGREGWRSQCAGRGAACSGPNQREDRQ